MKILLAAFLICLTAFVQAQQLNKKFSIQLADNYNTQYLENNYRITNDSLIITSISDKGSTHVNYLKRKLTKEEKKSISTFLLTYNVDSLKEEYFSDYTNLKMIDYLHFPRIIKVDFESNHKLIRKTKLTNCYVIRIANLIEIINTLLPLEVKIKYNRNDFETVF